jgi:hypothetical protein
MFKFNPLSTLFNGNKAKNYKVVDSQCESIIKEYCVDENSDECKNQYEKFCGKVNHDENVNLFFIELNKKLKEKDLCFVSGSYVFEGTKVFDYLIQSKHKKGVRIGQKVFGKKFISPASHNLHINSELFEAHKACSSNSVLVQKNTIAKNPEIYSKVLKDHIGYQYEIDLEKNSIPYPCDDECNTFETEYLQDKNEDINQYVKYNKTKLKCSYNKEVKKCVLFYVFAVNVPELSGNNIKYYTFVKLETMPTINPVDSAKHLTHAYNHYFTEHGAKRKNLYPQRREDLLEHNNKLYKLSEVFRNENSEFNLIKQKQNTSPMKMKAYIYKDKDLCMYKKIDLCMYKKIDLCMENDDSFNFYNKYVRTRNELFLPEEIFEEFLPEYKSKNGGSKSKYVKTDERYRYNNYEYVIYKSNKKRYIRIKSKYTDIKSLTKK